MNLEFLTHLFNAPGKSVECSRTSNRNFIERNSVSRPSKVLNLLLSMLFMFTVVFSVYAEGSKDLYPSGAAGLRAYLQSRARNLNVIFDIFPTVGTMKVYAKVGETIYVGSSAQGLGSGTINLRTPNGTTYTSGTSTTVGVIANRTQELAGPNRTGVTTGYSPYTRIVGANEEGIWEIDFVPTSGSTSSTSQTAATQINANFAWTQATNQPNNVSFIAAFDISVGSSSNAATLIPGRVYCNNFNANMYQTSSTDNTKAFYGKFYVLTNVGYIYKVDANGQNGASFEIYSNNKGIQKATTGSANPATTNPNSWMNGEPAYKSTQFSAATDQTYVYDPRLPDNGTEDITHKMFFSYPATDMPESANIRYNGGAQTTTWLRKVVTTTIPVISNLNILGAEGGNEGIIGPDGATVSFTSNVAGKFTIKLTFSGGFTDRTISGDCVEGGNLVPWDGYDGASTPSKVTSGVSVSVEGSISAAEVHFPLGDVEINPQGFKIELLDASGNLYSPTRDLVYWDDTGMTNDLNSPSSPTQNLTGLHSNSGATPNGHKWGVYNGTLTTMFGNNKILDTWSYIESTSEIKVVSASVKNIDLSINSFTPSTTSTLVGNTITYTIVVANPSSTGFTDNAVGAAFGFTAPAGFNITSVTYGSGTGTFVENSRSAVSGNTFTSNFDLTSNGTITYTITGTVGVGMAHINSSTVTAYAMRPADYTDKDATSSILGTPTDPQVECDGGTSGVGCNNIKTTTVTVTNTSPVAVNDAGAVNENATLNVNEANGVIKNATTGDTDVDGDVLTVTAIRTGEESGTGTSGTVNNALAGKYGTLTLSSNGSYVYVTSPAATDSLYLGETVTDTFTYTISDGNGGTDVAQLVITITGTNDPPVAVDDAGSVNENATLTVTEANGLIKNATTGDSDVDGDALTVTAIRTGEESGTGTSGTVNNALAGKYGTLTLNSNGSYVYVTSPAATDTLYSGETVTDIFTYTISDGNGGTDAAQLVITITGTNDAPVAVNDAGAVNENATLNVNEANGVIKNTTTGDTDVDGDVLSVTEIRTGNVEGSGTAGTVGSALTGTYGELTLNADGSYTYNANNAINIPAGATATDVFNYTISDGKGGTDIATITFTITGTNNPPIANNDINQIPVNSNVSGLLSTNDKDIASVNSATILGDPFTFGVSKDVSGIDRSGNPVLVAGSLTINADGTYTFIPATDFVGMIIPVIYTGTGVNGGTDTAILSIEVLPKLVTSGNNPPVAQNDVSSTEVNVTVTSTVMNNDSDPDGDPITISGASIALNTSVQVSGTDTYGNLILNAGMLTLNTNGTYTYIPATGFIGTVNPVSYNISDGNGGTNSATLTINVIGNNGNNTFSNDDANSAPQGDTMTGNVLTNDFDPESNAQSVTSATSNATTINIGNATAIPGVGSLTLSSTGAYTFVPLSTFIGTVPVIYTACDNGTPQACDDATLYLTSLPNEVEFCAWRTTADANDWAADIWEGLDCATDTWIYSPTPPTNDRPTYIRHTVEIPVGSDIVSDSLFIETTGRLKVCGTLDIDNQIVFIVDETGKAGQLDNSCGGTSCTVTVDQNASIIVRKSFVNDPQIYPWSFISIPFDVIADSIFIAGTTDKANWGNLDTNIADFYIGQYDGQKRANDGFTNGSNYVNVPDSLIKANKGYILAGGDDYQPIDFKSEVGTQFLCGPTLVETSINVSSTGRSYCDEGWNLIGVPFVSAFNLNDAWAFEPYFVWNGVDNYTTVMADDNYLVYPFSSFFIQDWLQAYDGLTYDIEGKTFKAVKSATRFDEISLVVSNGEQNDLTRIRLQENASVNFERNRDGIKMMSPVSSVPQIYTEASGSCAGLACNALPLNTSLVNLKLRTGKAGTYTIGMIDKEKLVDIKKVILVDTETKAQTNLMNQSYTFDITNATSTISSRFYVTLSTEEANGLNVIGGTGISVHSTGNKVYLNGLNGQADLRLFDAAGKLIYQFSGVENSVPVMINVPGLYIMDINANGQNARVKLIINN